MTAITWKDEGVGTRESDEREPRRSKEEKLKPWQLIIRRNRAVYEPQQKHP
jgi:hypothetical protein